MGRLIRTRLPTTTQKLIPEWPDHEAVKQRDAKAKDTSAKCYNRSHGARGLPPLLPGTVVRERLPLKKTWSEPMIVSEKTGERSYSVGGRRRNRRHLIQIPKEDETLPQHTHGKKNSPELPFGSSSGTQTSRPASSGTSVTRSTPPSTSVTHPTSPSTMSKNCTRSGRLVKPVNRFQGIP